MTIINLTPHNINICGNEYHSEGNLRVNTKEIDVSDVSLVTRHTGIPVVTREFTYIENLPERREDTIYIVSSMVLDAIHRLYPERNDFYAPDTGPTAIRNDKGHIVSVTRLIG